MRQYGEDIAAPVGNQPANRECQHDPNLLWSPSTRPLYWHGLVNGKRTTLDHDPYTSFLKRLGISLMKWLPIESQI